MKLICFQEIDNHQLWISCLGLPLRYLKILFTSLRCEVLGVLKDSLYSIKVLKDSLYNIHVQFDELTEPMAPVHICTGPEPILLTPGQISSGLVPDFVLAAPYVPPTNKDLEILFQSMFDEYFEPLGVERPVPLAPVVQVPVVSTSTPSSTTINQDAPSTSYSLSSSIVQPPISHQGVTAGPTIDDNPLIQADNDPFLNMFAPEPSSDESSSRDVSSAESTQVVHPHNHIGKWSKDHPLDYVIGGMIDVVSGVVSCCGLFKFVL
ncbi:hypothetical protein Tco_0445933 [Tanacetum coccineum]